MKRTKAVMHFNKPGSYQGRPWSVHWRGTCYMGHEVQCRISMKSEWKPDKPKSPRAFFTAMAVRVWIRDGVIFVR